MKDGAPAGDGGILELLMNRVPGLKDEVDALYNRGVAEGERRAMESVIRFASGNQSSLPDTPPPDPGSAAVGEDGTFRPKVREVLLRTLAENGGTASVKTLTSAVVDAGYKQSALGKARTRIKIAGLITSDRKSWSITDLGRRVLRDVDARVRGETSQITQDLEEAEM